MKLVDAEIFDALVEWKESRAACFESERTEPEMWQRYAKAERELIAIADRLVDATKEDVK